MFDITVFKKMQPTYTTVKMFEVGTIFLMILKSTYLIKNYVKTVILWNIKFEINTIWNNT